MKLNDIESCIRVRSWHNLEDAMKKGKGVVLVTAHLGGFELVGQIRSVRTTVLVESLKPPSFLSLA